MHISHCGVVNFWLFIVWLRILKIMMCPKKMLNTPLIYVYVYVCMYMYMYICICIYVVYMKQFGLTCVDKVILSRVV